MKNILTIEDDKHIAELEQDYLEINGFKTELAADGTSGLRMALEEDFDLIVLDLMLPGADGLAVCKALRQKKDTPHHHGIRQTGRCRQNSRPWPWRRRLYGQAL